MTEPIIKKAGSSRWWIFAIVLVAVVLCVCVAGVAAIVFSVSQINTSGYYYILSAVDSEGKQLNTTTVIAEGTAIYSMRNALCDAYPKAIVLIKDANTGEELKSESPYHCH